MSTYNKDVNFQLTQHNQRMRMELYNYRSEMIKLRQELLKQREENAVLKTTLTSEFLKVSKSFNIIFKLLENTCNNSLDDTLKSVNNSLSKINNTNNIDDTIKNDATIRRNSRNYTEIASFIGKDTSIGDDLSNFSFDVDNEDGIPIAEPVDMILSEMEVETNLNDPQCDENVGEESSLEENGMTIIQEESEESRNESSIRFDDNIVEKERHISVDMNISEPETPQKVHVQFVGNVQNEQSPIESAMTISYEEASVHEMESSIHSKENAYRQTIVHNDSSIIEDSFKVTSTPSQHRSTNETKRSLELFSPSKIPLRNCSVLLHSINKNSSEISLSDRSSTRKLSVPLLIPKHEKLSINFKENVESISDNGKKVERKYKGKSPERRLPGRKAAPKILTEKSMRVKLRRN